MSGVPAKEQRDTTRVFLNGNVFDGRHHRRQEAVAVRGDRIVATGPVDTVVSTARGAEQVDLQGGLLLPGFHDAHLHPLTGGLERLRCELTDLTSVDEYLAAIRGHGGPPGPDGWVRGGGWSVDAFSPHGPTADLLDRAVPDRPAFIVSSDHHNAWVNTRALEAAGIDAGTPDPQDGWIERDERGNPTGTLREAAVLLVQRHVTTTREENAAALREAQAYLHSWGLTGWHDALIGGYAGLDDPTQAYLDLHAAGDLTAHVTASLWWDRRRGPEQIADLRGRSDRLRAAGLGADSVKLMLDGIAETFTAAVDEPYLGETGCPCGSHGLSFLSERDAVAAVVALDAAGFQVHVHAIGDRAVRTALDGFEAARAAHGPTALRHQVAHLQLVRPRDRGRFAELGVTANVQGMWVDRSSAGVRLVEPMLGEERMAWHYPFADIAAAGAHLAGGSDWPVNPPEPMAAVHALVNRRPWTPDGEPVEPLVPAQALTLHQALAAYTAGAAWVGGHDDAGRITPGANADLVVLDRDPFLGPPDAIGASRVTATYVGGRRVHTRDEA